MSVQRAIHVHLMELEAGNVPPRERPTALHHGMLNEALKELQRLNAQIEDMKHKRHADFMREINRIRNEFKVKEVRGRREGFDYLLQTLEAHNTPDGIIVVVDLPA